MKKYWSIQTKSAWEHALNVGHLVGNTNFVSTEYFGLSYDWMKKQMNKRLPTYNNEQPIWLWLKKPDMRASAHHNKGTEIVRITIEMEEEHVLISDFDKWHCVLNDNFCSDSESEEEDFNNQKLSITKVESWERIFELDRTRDSTWWGDQTDLILQGTTGKIPIHSIKKVEHFIAR